MNRSRPLRSGPRTADRGGRLGAVGSVFRFGFRFGRFGSGARSRRILGRRGVFAICARRRRGEAFRFDRPVSRARDGRAHELRAVAGDGQLGAVVAARFAAVAALEDFGFDLHGLAAVFAARRRHDRCERASVRARSARRLPERPPCPMVPGGMPLRSMPRARAAVGVASGVGGRRAHPDGHGPAGGSSRLPERLRRSEQQEREQAQRQRERDGRGACAAEIRVGDGGHLRSGAGGLGYPSGTGTDRQACAPARPRFAVAGRSACKIRGSPRAGGALRAALRGRRGRGEQTFCSIRSGL
jgi:hypothetical protein